jgi:hypothetical protein
LTEKTASGADLTDTAFWRGDIDSLAFPVREHGGICVVHRRAFRTLLRAEPGPDDCMAYFSAFDDVFRAAAAVKIAQKQVPPGRNLHLTSRDIARKLIEMRPVKQGGSQCPSP